jgi:GxxExxY protein
MEQYIHEFVQNIYNELGPGYSECVYHKAMEVLLRKQGVQYESERIVPIVFHGHTIGNVRSDIIVDGKLVLEFKSVRVLTDAAALQTRNYLRLTGLSLGYLINFGHQKLEVVRIEASEETPLP